MDLFESLEQKITGKNLSIVFPEGNDARILGAAVRLAAEGLIKPVLLGTTSEIAAVAEAKGLDISKLELRDPQSDAILPEMAQAFFDRRNGKATEEQAQAMVKDPNYFGTMLVYMGKADGMVSGAVHSTADTVRPALQIIKTRPGVSRTSGAFIMQRGRDERYLFADNAINIDPDAQTLAETAVESAKTAKLFDIDPKVAMLSFSTKGSAKAPQVDKVIEATKLAHELAPDLALDGELQFDAAFVPTVAKLKAPDSKVAGYANVFIFPDLQSGNIGYKIAQRLGGFEAMGPILQGLNKPVSDLSRGANEEDVYKVAIITAAQNLIN
ncbi:MULTISPECIES: phosphate acetyltransferase [Lacticaseibacillus]|uniref:phosphate acetyltransferase n=1 Tax=Lacticaseibacillus TaxID=2759736 RepID=UPI000F7878A6|nr:phosphate acetyltransferase [Lacticaseibacillus suibinensis]